MLHVQPELVLNLWEGKTLWTAAINRSLGESYFIFPPPTRIGLTFLVLNHINFLIVWNEIINLNAIYKIMH